MKRILILLLLILPTAYGLTPLYVGPVTTGNNPVATSNGAVADCIKIPTSLTVGLLVTNPNPNPFFPPSPARPTLGETGYATLDATNPANAALIAQNGGSASFVRMEACTPNGNLAEIACSDGYLGVPTNYVGAIEYTPADVGGNVQCTSDGMAFFFSTGFSVQPHAAFFHRKQPGLRPIKPGTPGPGINYNVNCATQTLSVNAIPTTTGSSIKRVWVETAPPASILLVSINGCPSNQPCTTAMFNNIPIGVDLHMYALDSNRMFAVESVRC